MNTHLDPDVDASLRESRFGLGRPASLLKFLELRAILETASLLPFAPLLALAARGDGRQVMVVPGFMTDDRITWPLRKYLTWLGYDALPWDMGRNNGLPERDAATLAQRLEREPHAQRGISMIGWSLGGVIAREVARLLPGTVREVITMGTPVEGGPKYTIAGEKFARRNKIDLPHFESHVHDINRKGVTQPLTVIYSHGDGIVGWRAAIDRYNAHARHVRIPGSHLGLGTNPLVWRAIATALSDQRAT